MALSLALPLAASLLPFVQPAPSKPAFMLQPEHAYAPSAPALEVVTLDLTLHDEARNKDLELRIRAPKAASPDQLLPLIIFSHGAGGSNDAFPELSTH